jgi:hypothetical protein
MEIAFRGIKGEEARLSTTGHCVVFTGRGSSGKTARIDAIRLAMTGKCSVGASQQNISSIVPQGGFADANGGNWRARWEMGAGKRPSSSYVLEGNPVEPEAIIGSIPTTMKDFLALTREQQWDLITGLVGVGSETEQITTRLKSLKKRLSELSESPAPYDGEPIDILTSSLANLQKQIEAQSGAKSRPTVSLTEARIRVEKLQESIEEAERDQSLLEGKIRLFMATDGAEPAAILNMRSQGKTRWEAILFALKEVCTLLSAAQKLCSEGSLDTERDALSGVTKKAEALLEEFSESPDFTDNLRLTLPEFKGFSPVVERQFAYRKISSLREDLEVAKENLRLAEEFKSQSVELLSAEQLEGLIAERNRVRDRVSQAAAWALHVSKTQEREAEISEVTNRINDLEQRLSHARDERAVALKSILSSVASRANRYLYGLGWEMRLSINSTPKTQSLVIENADGVELMAMAGNEQAIYGLALLCAIQDLSSAIFPVIFHECAEIEPDRMRLVAEAIADHRTKGCVFLSHWADPQCNSRVNVIRVGR